MKKFIRSKLSVAVAIALSTGLGFSSSASAVAVDAATGNMLNTDTGDLLLFPYYTVRDDANGNPFVTSFTITNTDPVNSVWVKFRLRDHVNSQDVLDLMLIMSPNDEVVAYLNRDPTTGRPVLNFPNDEKTCRVPWNNGASSFVSPDGVVSTADAQEGHLEVIPIAALPVRRGLIGANVPPLHGNRAVHGANQDCAGLSNVISNGSQSGYTDAAQTTNAINVASFNLGLILNTLDTVAVPNTVTVPATPGTTGYNGASGAFVGNVLRGAYTITAVDSGFSGGGQAIAVANWDNGKPNAGFLAFGQNNLAVAAANQVTQLNRRDTLQWDHPHLGDLTVTSRLDGVLSTGVAPGFPGEGLAYRQIYNNWSTNPDNGVGIDWVVTYFTKYLYQDTNGFYGAAGGVYVWPPALTPYTGPATAYAPNSVTGIAGGAAKASPWNTAEGTPSLTNGARCIRAAVRIYDREEQTTVLGGVSPGPAVNTNLCREVNVLSFQNAAGQRPVLKTVANGAVRIDATTTSNSNYGWSDVTVNPNDAPGLGIAVGGFSFTIKDLNDPTKAFGSIVNHTVVP